MPDSAGVELNPFDHNGECRYCDEQAMHAADCPWLDRLVKQTQSLMKIIRKQGVVGEQAEADVLLRATERLGWLEERRVLEEARDAALNGVALHQAAADSLAEQCRELAGKIQFLVDWADANKLLEDHVFTFPDGDIWEAKK